MYSIMITPVCTDTPKSAHPDSGGDTEMGIGKVEGDESADGSKNDRYHDQCGPPE